MPHRQHRAASSIHMKLFIPNKPPFATSSTTASRPFSSPLPAIRGNWSTCGISRVSRGIGYTSGPRTRWRPPRSSSPTVRKPLGVRAAIGGGLRGFPQGGSGPFHLAGKPYRDGPDMARIRPPERSASATRRTSPCWSTSAPILLRTAPTPGISSPDCASGRGSVRKPRPSSRRPRRAFPVPARARPPPERAPWQTLPVTQTARTTVFGRQRWRDWKRSTGPSLRRLAAPTN